jgi:serine/threonine protein kinase
MSVRAAPPSRTYSTPRGSALPSHLGGRILGGRYRVGDLLGAGAMGCVYQAEHVELGRRCAVKVIHPPYGDADAAIAARFRIEALATGRLDHPNVLRVLDFGSDPADGLSYLVTEQLDGEDLADVLATQGRLPVPRLAAIGRQICGALQHAHDRGVIHRDLKPENVRLVRREGDDRRVHELVVVLDFGTALVEGAGAEITAEGLVLGTPAYMSPEQSSGGVVDRRSDLYAVGVLLFELATGRLPFERTSWSALAAAHAASAPPAPRALAPDLDPELEALILWCLAKRPADRPQQAREIRAALDALARRPPEVRHEPPRVSAVLPVIVGILLALLTDAVVRSPPLAPRSAAGEVRRCPPGPTVRASHGPGE